MPDPRIADPFFDYVRGHTDAIPAGYSENGMRAYRHLVFLGASQMIEASYPLLRPGLGEEAWRQMIEAFVRQSAWRSPYYGDMKEEFLAFLARENAAPSS